MGQTELFKNYSYSIGLGATKKNYQETSRQKDVMMNANQTDSLTSPHKITLHKLI